MISQELMDELVEGKCLLMTMGLASGKRLLLEYAAATPEVKALFLHRGIHSSSKAILDKTLEICSWSFDLRYQCPWNFTLVVFLWFLRLSDLTMYYHASEAVSKIKNASDAVQMIPNGALERLCNQVRI